MGWEARARELERRVQELEAELAQSRTVEGRERELTRSNQDLELFAYAASHDLQEPLRQVVSYLQLLKRRYGDRLEGEATEFLDYAVDGGQRMQRLISDLLAYSRVGREDAPVTLVDCNAVVQNVVEALERVIDENGASVTYGALPAVRGNPGMLFQVFQNLIANALKFRSEAPPEVRVTATRGEGEWQFAVQDNGIGIEPAYWDRVFVVFRRLHRREAYPGTGIGLALCRKIVEWHGGRIWIESEPDKGSTFYFTLPEAKEGNTT